MYSIVHVEVDWFKEFTNNPQFRVQFVRDDEEKIVSILRGEDFKYYPKSSFYRSIMGERADFLSHPTRGTTNAGGHGGRTITITLHDNSKLDLQGPWSGSSSSVNEVFNDGNDVVEVSIIDPAKTSLFRTSGAATVAGIVRWIKENNPDFGIAQVELSGKLYMPCRKDGSLKNPDYKIIQRLA